MKRKAWNHMNHFPLKLKRKKQIWTTIVGVRQQIGWFEKIKLRQNGEDINVHGLKGNKLALKSLRFTWELYLVVPPTDFTQAQLIFFTKYWLV